ncbi:hypothetical protein LL033_25180 (plasmid) [Clostridium estertheticum]|uniref:hypothetical protein n=1 Tax=Clostridium estertheticum TaxID=238834 RepID=UPI001C0B65D8|nr:hypothetical protein [Clostridium estertheticum]MBU3217235.1 hypothetical protein [Clostridium estertheticum]WAG58417.1 hypothetical protein LL033_25180 [Clostridium estertheticum]
MNESEHYNENYTKQEIDVLLLKIKDCVNRNKFTVEQNKNRQENKKLIENYNLSHSKIKAILLNIETTDFCYSLQNKKIGYEYEILYVFCPQRTLFNILGEEEFVDIYTKFNIIEYDNNIVYTVSFHKKNKLINYLFR